jgi:predicted AAA+ superfamily ATPase
MFPLGLPEAVGDFSRILNDGEVFANGGKFAKTVRDAKVKQAAEGLALLRKFGGFPEPFLRGEEEFHRRWQKDYKTLIAREEVRDLSQIQDIRGVEVLIEVLPTKVGSPLSIKSLSDDLAYNQRTIARWIDILSALYLVFTLRPWHRKITRAIKKEPKLYFYDWSLLTDEGNRFENLIAVSLIRMAARLTEKGLGDYEIRYIRDREKREVDFVMVKDDSPICLIEAKEGGREISKNGRYYSDKLGIPFYQIVNRAESVEEYPGNCFVIPATNFLMLA